MARDSLEDGMDIPLSLPPSRPVSTMPSRDNFADVTQSSPQPVRHFPNSPTRANSTDLSKNAELCKELNQLRKSHHSLQRQHQATCGKISELCSENRRLKAKVKTMEQQLETANKRAEMCVKEKVAKDNHLSADRDYIKRLEARVTLQGGSGLAARNAALETKAKALKDEVRELTAQCAGKDSEVQQLQRELSVLQNAISLRDDDPHMREVYDIANSRQENLELALALADKTAAINALTIHRDALLSKVEELTAAAQVSSSDLTSFSNQVRRLSEELATAHQRLQDSAVEQDVMKAFIQEEAEKKGALEEAYDHLKSESEQEIRMLKRELEIANGGHTALQADLRSSEASHREEIASLNAALATKEKTIRELDGKTQEFKAQVEAKLRELEVQSTREADLRSEINSLHAEMDHFTEVNERLHSQLRKEQSEKGDALRRLQQLTEESSAVRQELSGMSAEKAAVERSVRQRLEATMSELQSLTQEREQLNAAVAEAVARCSASLATQQSLEQELLSMREHMDSLSRAKTVLQRSLVEQTDDLKQQLSESNARVSSLQAQLDALLHSRDSEQCSTSVLPGHAQSVPSHRHRNAALVLPPQQDAPVLLGSLSPPRDHARSSSSAPLPRDSDSVRAADSGWSSASRNGSRAASMSLEDLANASDDEFLKADAAALEALDTMNTF